MHTEEQYKEFDEWIYRNSNINFSDIDALRNNPSEAKEEIRQEILTLFMNERARLESEGVKGSKANSIDGYADYLFSNPTTDGPLVKKMDEIKEWQSHIDIGEQWDDNLGKWESGERVLTGGEAEIVKDLPSFIPEGKTAKDFVDEGIPYEVKRTKEVIPVPADAQEWLIKENGPDWRADLNKNQLKASLAVFENLKKLGKI